MATANTKSNAITNAEATPLVHNPRYLTKAPVFEAVATVEVAAADDDGSVYRFFRIPSNAVVLSLQLFNDAITAGTSYDFGLLQTAANGGTATGADADVFATAVDLSSARVAPLDITFEALNIDKIEKRIWELLGLSADSQREYEVCATANTVGSAAGTISMRLRYTV